MTGALEQLYAEAREAFDRGDFKAMRYLAQQLYTRSKDVGDRLGMAHGHNLLGNVFMHASADGESAERYYRSALALYREADDRRGIAVAVMNLGSLALNFDLDLGKARGLYEESLPIFQELRDELSEAMNLANLAEIYRLEGDYTRAFEYGSKSLDTFVSAGDAPRAAWQMVNLAQDYLLRSDYAEAIRMLRRAYEVLTRSPNPERLALYFETWFYLACELHAYKDAARILGFLEVYRQQNDIPRLALLMPWFTPRVERLQRVFSYDELDALRTEGSLLKLEQAEALTHLIASPE